tara:strand:- start:151 stop:624 length:474 start_codon:yes stop_codon:yes gene_type:complete
MPIHNYNSWGRTRQPKNLTGKNGEPVTLLANTNTLKASYDTSGGSPGKYKTQGYSTENQRYLHVLVEDADQAAPAAVTIFGYCHAFEQWFEIPDSNLYSGNSAPTAASVAVNDSTRSIDDQFPSDKEFRIYHIVGIDRVAFVGVDANVNVYAAGSTF